MLRQAQQVAQIAAVQNPLSVVDTRYLSFAQKLAEEQIAFLAYYPTGTVGLNARAETVAQQARQQAMSVSQYSLTWLLAQADNILPIPGTSSIEHLRENMKALTLAHRLTL